MYSKAVFDIYNLIPLNGNTFNRKLFTLFSVAKEHFLRLMNIQVKLCNSDNFKNERYMIIPGTYNNANQTHQMYI